MLRTVLVALCSFLLRIFFRRIEVVGRHHLPREGALVFALNHPSGLIDPLFVLCLSGERVSFLAKEPLFRMPFVGVFVRAFESLPVYRSRDGGDPQKNREMMQNAAALLGRGNALALFPEGTSHSDPTLKRFRSGAARIALSARAQSEQEVFLVPGALYYENKQIFRSRAVLAFGPPIPVAQVSVDESGEPAPEIAQELTENLRHAIQRIMPTADTVDGLVLAEQAERVLSAAVRDTPEKCPTASALLNEPLDRPRGKAKPLSLAERMQRRRRLIDAYFDLAERHPETVVSLIKRLARLQEVCSDAGLGIDAPAKDARLDRSKVVGGIFVSLLLFPFALVGLLTSGPTYQLIRLIAFRYSGSEEDVTATVKLLSGLLLFPATWLVLGAGLGWALGSPVYVLSALLGPSLGFSALRFSEITGALRRRFEGERAKVPMSWDMLLEERAQVAEEMARLLRQT